MLPLMGVDEVEHLLLAGSERRVIGHSVQLNTRRGKSNSPLKSFFHAFIAAWIKGKPENAFAVTLFASTSGGWLGEKPRPTVFARENMCSRANARLR